MGNVLRQYGMLFFYLLVVKTTVFSQEKLRKQLDSIKTHIRQSTYYDSASVFTDGAKAVALAKRLDAPQEEAIIYQYYGNFFYFSSQVDKAIEYYNKSLEIARKYNDKKTINSTKIRLVFMHADKDPEGAKKEFNQLLKEAIKGNYTDNTIELYNGLGYLYNMRLMNGEALNYYLKALKIANAKNMKFFQAMLLNNIGLQKLMNKQYNEAKKDFIQGLEILKNSGEDRMIFHLNNNLGLLTKEQKKFHESIIYYQNTLKMANKLGFPLGRAVAYLNLSDSYKGEGQFETALNYSDTASKLLFNAGQWHYYSMSFLIRADILNGMKKPKQALACIDSVYLYDKMLHDASLIAQAHDIQAEIFNKTGNYKKAYEHYKLFKEMSDSLSEVTNTDKIARLQVAYGKEQMESDLESMRSKNKLLQKENELKQTRVKYTIASAVFAIFSLFGIFYIRNSYQNKKRQRYFTRKLIKDIDDERSRISKDLHDDIGQSLSVIKSKLNLFQKGILPNVNSLETEVGDVINVTREISHQLHPSFIQKLGLEKSLEALIEKTQDNTGLVCSLETEIDLQQLTIEEQTHVYRIIQECINNTLKHAGASALKVTATEQNDNLLIHYQDNGKGIDSSDQESDGIGMLTIRERAKSLDAKIQLVSSKGKGFSLYLIIPKDR